MRVSIAAPGRAASPIALVYLATLPERLDITGTLTPATRECGPIAARAARIAQDGFSADVVPEDAEFAGSQTFALRFPRQDARHVLLMLAGAHASIDCPLGILRLDGGATLMLRRQLGVHAWLLLGAICVGAVLRGVDLSSTPPGFNQDEAVNGYDAYSLARTVAITTAIRSRSRASKASATGRRRS